MFDRDSCIKCHRNRLVFFSQKKVMREMGITICSLFRTVSSFVVLQNVNNLSESFDNMT